MVHRKHEAERGLDPDSDLFSPGYFKMALGGGDTTAITAVTTSAETEVDFDSLNASPMDLS